MKQIFRFLVFIGICPVLAGGAARGQTLPPNTPRIEIAVNDELILKPDEIRPVQRDSSGNLITRPGEIIQYTLTATNIGLQPAHDVEIVDPIPEGTEYVLESARGEGMIISCSIDGGRLYQSPPVVHDFQRPDGVIEKRAAPASAYTHVKWLVPRPILPGAQVTAFLQVRVIAGNAPGEEE